MAKLRKKKAIKRHLKDLKKALNIHKDNLEYAHTMEHIEVEIDILKWVLKKKK